MDFRAFKTAIQNQFNLMTDYHLFRVQVERNELWDLYLASFPEGSNPIYRERTEHDCSACRHFIRTMGSVVAVNNLDEVITIWDVKVDDPEYQVVADALAALVKSRPIVEPFVHYEGTAGVDTNVGMIGEDVVTFDHFFVNLPDRYVLPKARMGSMIGQCKTNHDVAARGLKEITMEATSTVIELIDQNSLYRGDEHKSTVLTFQRLLDHYDGLSEHLRDNFVWRCTREPWGPPSLIRNTAIGTLLVDLSNGVDIDQAVRSFETIVAPTNYKRPTAVVTQSMVNSAREKVEELGLTSALERRFATMDDIDPNDVLFLSRNITSVRRNDPFDSVPVSEKKKFSRVEEISIEDFIKNVLPSTSILEVLVENRHIKNLVSLTTAQDPKASPLFKWDNPFAWSYNGDLADSIKERVKKAGGNVTADLCCRLSWFNLDDLDIHMTEPNGQHIYYGSKGPTRNGGRLDVDMNAGTGHTREPVENIFYPSMERMSDGVYTLSVHNFCKRENRDDGFTVEIEYLGDITTINYGKPVRNSQTIEVAQIQKTSSGIEIIKSLEESHRHLITWGMQTGGFVKVRSLMLSPNHWGDNHVGNKHYFFFLDGCRADGSIRGFYNEFLRDSLTEHRKVLEIVGSKTRISAYATQDQLSGLGFSSTQRDHITVRVSGSFVRILKVNF